MRMKITLVGAGILAIATTIGNVAPANDIALVSNYDQTEATPAPITAGFAKEMPVPESKAAPNCGGCGHCDQCTPPGDCNGCNGSLFSRIGQFFGSGDDLPCATPCPRFGGYVLSGFDSWCGITSGTLQNNNGIINGFNLGARCRSSMNMASAGSAA